MILKKTSRRKSAEIDHLVIPTSAAETAKIRNVTFLKTNLHVDHIGEVWRNFNCQIYMTLFRLYWLSLKVSKTLLRFTSYSHDNHIS